MTASFLDLNIHVLSTRDNLGISDVHGPASSCGPGQAKLGQNHGLTTTLAWLEILESQSHWPRPRLLTENFGTRRAYPRLSNNNFGIISQIIAIFRINPRRKPIECFRSIEFYIAYLAHLVIRVTTELSLRSSGS
jgi:hypothetical protein